MGSPKTCSGFCPLKEVMLFFRQSLLSWALATCIFTGSHWLSWALATCIFIGSHGHWLPAYSFTGSHGLWLPAYPVLERHFPEWYSDTGWRGCCGGVLYCDLLLHNQRAGLNPGLADNDSILNTNTSIYKVQHNCSHPDGTQCK